MFTCVPFFKTQAAATLVVSAPTIRSVNGNVVRWYFMGCAGCTDERECEALKVVFISGQTVYCKNSK